MNAKQLKNLIEMILKMIGKYSEEAVDLLMLTAAQESHCGKYIRQIGTGPARGIFQMEPDTLSDLYANFLSYKKPLLEIINEFRTSQSIHIDLEGNLPFQIVAARFQYFRQKGAIPKSENFNDDFEYVEALAKYWKRHWNTELGAGTVEEAVQNYYRFVVNEIA